MATIVPRIVGAAREHEPVSDLAWRGLYHSLRASHLFWLWHLTVLLYIRLRLPGPSSEYVLLPSSAPSIDVVLPVRDEERNIEAVLCSLLAQDYPNYQVTVVDDGSQDRTLSLARLLEQTSDRLVVVEGRPLPPRWVGKSWASHQGARQGQAEWVLFTDADVRLHPHALSQALGIARQERADLLSVVQHLECRGFWEKVLQPAFAQFILAVRPPSWVQSKRFKMAYATGQFILVRRNVYERLGGYEAVRGEIADDVALAGLVKRGGGRLLLMNATKLVEVRMYHGLREIWTGWRKGLYPASGASPLLAAAALLLLTGTSVLPVLTLVGRLLRVRRAPTGPAAISVLLMLLARVTGDVTLRVSPWYGMFQPLAASVLGANFAASVLRHYSGKGQQWKGRTYR